MTLDYGNIGILLSMGNAGFLSSAVGAMLGIRQELLALGLLGLAGVRHWNKGSGFHTRYRFGISFNFPYCFNIEP